MGSTEEYFGPVIYSYTSEEAVADGVLVDVDKQTSRNAGFKIPVRITCGVHALCTPPESNEYESYEGRLWDVLNVAHWAIRRHIQSRAKGSVIEFCVKLGRNKERLWIAPDGTSGEALHIMTPDEY